MNRTPKKIRIAAAMYAMIFMNGASYTIYVECTRFVGAKQLTFIWNLSLTISNHQAGSVLSEPLSMLPVIGQDRCYFVPESFRMIMVDCMNQLMDNHIIY